MAASVQRRSADTVQESKPGSADRRRRQAREGPTTASSELSQGRRAHRATSIKLITRVIGRNRPISSALKCDPSRGRHAGRPAAGKGLRGSLAQEVQQLASAGPPKATERDPRTESPACRPRPRSRSRRQSREIGDTSDRISQDRHHGRHRGGRGKAPPPREDRPQTSSRRPMATAQVHRPNITEGHPGREPRPARASAQVLSSAQIADRREKQFSSRWKWRNSWRTVRAA